MSFSKLIRLQTLSINGQFCLMRETRVTGGSSWLSARIQLFSEWKTIDNPRCMMPALWAHLVLDPGSMSRCMSQPSAVGCVWSAQRRHQVLQDLVKGKPLVGGGFFLRRAGGLGADWAKGWMSLGENWRPEHFLVCVW